MDGITLIALIITIIVMLILVAVAVNTAVQSGLFGHAQKATGDWKKREQEEGNIGNDNQINDIVNEYKYGGETQKPERSHLKIGDYVDYVPDTVGNYMKATSATTGSNKNPTTGIPQDKTLNWRVMSINEDGTVDIISETATTSTISIHGAVGYNNGVYLLNDLCSAQYSNFTLGAVARSVNLEDVERNLNETGQNARNNATSTGKSVKYGNTTTYSSNLSNVPDIYDNVSKDTAGEVENYYSEPTNRTYSNKGSLSIKQTFYSIPITRNYYDEPTYYDVLFGTEKAHWIAARYVDCADPSVDFGLRALANGFVGGQGCFFSNGTASDTVGNAPVRPVVTLGSDIKISETGGTVDSPRTLSK